MKLDNRSDLANMPMESAGYFIRLNADTDLPLYQRENQMPATKIGRWTDKHKEIQRKRAATRRARVAKMTTLSSSDYKKFCDICFEFYIRWRDRWNTRMSPETARQISDMRKTIEQLKKGANNG